MKRTAQFSPAILTTVAGLVMVALSTSRLLQHSSSYAAGAQPNLNCTLIIPADPLSAKGLATPYQLVATHPQQGPCHEPNPAQSAFVQSVIYNPTTGTFSVYSPLVIDKGAQPALVPPIPTLPRGAIVGIWFGFNGNNLLLQGVHSTTFDQAHCVNGLGPSLFGQFAYCNAPAFFAAVNQGIVTHRVQIPPLQMAKDGLPCPTVRDFSVVDQDQSDNVQTQYLATVHGQIAQFSAANQAKLHTRVPISNPSDNALLTRFINPALGCQSWQAPNLADHNRPVPALALDEVQAAAEQKAPLALVPLTDPMTMVTLDGKNQPSLAKTNLYRLGVDQIPAVSVDQANGTTYCRHLLQTGLPRLQRDRPLTIRAPSPNAAVANTLFTFLAQRFQASYTLLRCAQLLKRANPVTVQTDANGVVISATFKGKLPADQLTADTAQRQSD